MFPRAKAWSPHSSPAESPLRGAPHQEWHPETHLLCPLAWWRYAHRHGAHRTLLRAAAPMACRLRSFRHCRQPKLIKDFGNNTLRSVKTDKADAKKIARYALDNWYDLPQHTGMDTTRTKLKTINRQFAFCIRQRTACKNNLIALIDQVYPGTNTYFESPARATARKNGGTMLLPFDTSIMSAR